MMKRHNPLFACMALAATAGVHRRVQLSDEDKNKPGVVRYLSQRVELAEGATQSWVTVTRTGTFTDPRYGQFDITPDMLKQMVSNFDNRVLGQDVFFDVAHKPNDGAAAKVVKLSVENGRLRALAEWTPFGIDAVENRGFAYLSADYHENWSDNEQGKAHGCVLLGAGLTTRPVIKNLEAVTLSTDESGEGVRFCISPQLLKQLSEGLNMNFIEQLKAKLLAMGVSGDALNKMLAQAKQQMDDADGDEKKCATVQGAWDAMVVTLSEQIKAAGAGDGKAVTVQLSMPENKVDVSAELNKLLAERDKAAANAQTTLAAKHKLLSDTIAAGDTTLTPEGVKTLSKEVAVMLTADSTDEQVKALAQMVVNSSKKLSAAQKLATLGYASPNGHVHITVDSSNSIKSLQETIDRRLGYADMSETKRYEKTGGKLLAENKAFADRALVQFDALNGHRLDAEHKMLAGGTGAVSDVAVPVIAERTVLREALYSLTSLNFVNVGTAPFTQVITVPYSYRDVTAAGINALRRYEGQGIRNAGVIQTSEEARPLPQKLGFRVTSELRALLSSSVIDFDPVSENIRNIVRIVGEDTEALNINEMVCSADEASVATQTDTLTAQVNGTNKVFVLTKFPVVRPRKVYDLTGAQVGATANAMTVTLDGTARNEYLLPSDGSALSNGTYYVMDYNLGELRFVDQTGAAVTPANTTTLTVAYSATTNAVKFDTDVPSGLQLKDYYDNLLVAIGGRKASISADRYYNPNTVLMSATVDNMLSQARSFEANATRLATGLATDGSVGQVKGMPAFNTSAPGLLMGDTRIVVGERGNTRFRMVKPFAMNPMEQARNAAGQFIDAQESFGTQWVVSHTPKQLKNSLTSVVLYSSSGRVARA